MSDTGKLLPAVLAETGESKIDDAVWTTMTMIITMTMIRSATSSASARAEPLG